MRFSTFFILACLGVVALVSGLNCYAVMAPAHARVHLADDRPMSSPDRVRVEREWGWSERSVPPRYVQPVLPRQQNVRYSFPQIGANDDVSNDGSMDFDWSRFGMALVLLAGGTLVCRRIFRSAAGGGRPTQLRQSSQPTQSARPSPPPAQAQSRMCPRADCGRMNPPMAKFCRRCGAALSEA